MPVSRAMYKGLVTHGVPAAQAAQLGHLPPLGYLFAAFLGLNPLKSLLGTHLLSQLSAADRADLLGRSFFPQLIGGPFKGALVYVLAFAVVMSLVAAAASAMRGTKYVHEDDESRAQKAMLTAAATSQGSPARGGTVLASAGVLTPDGTGRDVVAPAPIGSSAARASAGRVSR